MRKYYKYVNTSWTQPILTANGAIGGDEFACSHYYAFDGVTQTRQRGIICANVSGSSVTYPCTFLTFYNPNPLLLSNFSIL